MRRRVIVLACLLPALAALAGGGSLAARRGLLAEARRHGGPVRVLAFSPDATRLLSAAAGHSELFVWPCGALERHFGLGRPEREIVPLVRPTVTRPSGALVIPSLASAGFTRDERILCVIQGAGVRLFDGAGLAWEREEASSPWLAFPGDPGLAVVGREVIELRAGKTVRTLPVTAGPYAVSSDGRRVLADVYGMDLAWVDVATGEVGPPIRNVGPVTFVTTLGSDERLLAFGTLALRIHDATLRDTLVPLFSVNHEFFNPRAVVSPDGRWAIVREADDTRSALFDAGARSLENLAPAISKGERITAAAFAPDGQSVALGTESGRVLWVPVSALRE